MFSEQFKAKTRRFALPAAAALTLAGMGAGLVRTFSSQAEKGEKVSYSHFMDMARSHQIDRVLIDDDITTGEGFDKAQHRHRKYWITRPTTYDQIYALPGVDVDHEKKSFLSGEYGVLALAGWGTIAIALLGLVDARNKLLESGILGSRKFRSEKSDCTFADIAGIGPIKAELQDDILFLKDKDAGARLGGHPPKGLLVAGDTGSGKTLLAKAIAGEAGVPIIILSAASLANGNAERGIRALERTIQETGRCVVYIENIEAIAGQGASATFDGLLNMMDGIDRDDGVLFIAGTTSDPDTLAPGLLRAGRYEQTLRLPKPDVTARCEILELFAKKCPVAQGVDLQTIAEEAFGLSSAELKSLINLAALHAGRRPGAAEITHADFDSALDVVTGGLEKSASMTHEEKWRSAVHRAGHILLMCEKEEDGLRLPRKVTILPRDGALGVKQVQRHEERLHRTRKGMEAMLVMLHGGFIAEEMILGGPGEVGTGGADDIREATRLAIKMVAQLGFSDLGPVRYGTGKDESAAHDLGAQYLPVQREAKKILAATDKEARDRLEERKEDLELLAIKLMTRETLTADEVRALLAKKSAPAAPAAAPRPR